MRHSILVLLLVVYCTPVLASNLYIEDRDLQQQIAEVQNLELNLVQRKQAVRNKKHALRIKAAKLKKQQQEQKRCLRKQEKCAKVTREIEWLNQRLRNGYTITQGANLNRKLAEYREEKRKYCTNE